MVDEDRARDMVMLAQLRAGDDAAFARLVRGLDGLLRRLAAGIVKTQAEVDDVVQETWMAVIRGLGAFEGRSSIRTWICQILLNRARTRAVRAGRTVPMSALGDDSTEPAVDRFTADGRWATPPVAWSEERPDVLAQRGEVLAAVERAIAALPDRQREVILLRDVEGWSSEEVCNALDLTESNQRVLLHRARGRIRAIVEAAVASPGSTL